MVSQDFTTGAGESMSQRLLVFRRWIRSISLQFHRRGRAGLPSSWWGGLVGAGLGLLFFLIWLGGLAHIFEEVSLDVRYDLRYRVAVPMEPSPVTVVAIDDRAVDAFGAWPWPRVVQAEAMRALLEEKPSVVGITMFYSSPSQDFRGDQRLAQSLQSEIPVVLAASTSGAQERIPLLDFMAPNVYIGHTDLVTDWGGIVRRFDLEKDSSVGKLRALSWEMAQRLGAGAHLTDRSEESLRINFRPAFFGEGPRELSLAQTVSFVDVVEGTATDQIQGRPVIVGVTGSDGELTALRSFGPIPDAHIHAAALSMMLQDDYIREQPLWQVAVALIVGGVIVGMIGFMLRPWPSTVFFGVSLLAFLVFGVWRFAAHNEWIVTVPVVGLLVSTYVTGLWHAHSVSERTAREVRETFRRYVAPEVVDTLLSQPGVADMEGGRRAVSVLFADLRSFTSFSEANPPEEVVRVLNRYFALMSDSVLLFGGMVDKFVGDGVMALFGAPIPMENHAEAAMRASLHLLRNIERRNRSNKEGWSLTVGIGIHSGEAVVGSVGSAARLEYTAIGDVVNVAARLQELASPGKIIVSEPTFALLSEGLRKGGKLLEPIHIRGRKEPVIAYEFDLRPPKAEAEMNR